MLWGEFIIMKTILATVDSKKPEQKWIKQAADILKSGGLVAFPTETVYGLGANGLDAYACKKIYEAKGRPSDNPLILHIAEKKDLYTIVKEVPQKAEKLINAFWPGPLTMIFQKKDCVPHEITGGFSTVAVRFPSHAVAQAIIKASGLPIAAPSANSSGKPSPTKASHVIFDLDSKIDMIIDGGNAEVGLESTIIDVSEEVPTLLRPGAITKEMIENVIGRIEIDPTILTKPSQNLVPKAPGMKYTHYSPKADVILVQGDDLSIVQQNINQFAKRELQLSKKVGILATDQTKQYYDCGIVLSLGNRENLEEIGSNLFKHLRKFDFLGVETVYSETVPEIGEGLAIMNRLQKAAGYKVIKE